MCILLYVKLIWCSGIPYIYGQLEGGTSALSICLFCYMLNLFGLVVLHRSMVIWRKGHLYMCILLYVKLILCSGIPQIYGQLEGRTSALSICAFCYMLNLFGVGVFQRSMIDWRGYMCPRYKCILLYVKLIWPSGIPQIYDQMEGWYICHEYICTLLYVKRIWCSGVPYIYR